MSTKAIFKPIIFSEHPDAQRRYQEDIDMATRLIKDADKLGDYNYANLLMEFRESVVRLQIIEWGKRYVIQ
jgi:BioD-like phosphotransacetylase family protein